MSTRFKLGVGLACLGFVLVFPGCDLLLKYHNGQQRREVAKRSWTSLPAIVTKVEADPYKRGYFERVLYQYEFRGTTYTSEGSTFFGSFRYDSSEMIKGNSAGIWPGQHIEVFVNPSIPAEAVRLPWLISDEEVSARIENGVLSLIGGGLSAAFGALLMWIGRNDSAPVRANGDLLKKSGSYRYDPNR